MSGELRLDEPAPNVVRLTFTNPAKRNALDHTILDGIAETLPTLETRCLLITAEGPVFSAGYDIGDLPRERAAPDEIQDEFAERAEKLVAHPFHAAIEAIEAYPYPAVAAINGHAIGGGLELALSCDLRVAAAGAKMGMPPAKLGLVYSHTGLRKFIDAIGVPRTRELFYVGRNITAEQGLAWGLVNEVVPDDAVERSSLELAREVASNAPLATRGNKRAIETLARFDRLTPEQERELIELRRSCFASEDFREGIRAFAEKRSPVWRGR